MRVCAAAQRDWDFAASATAASGITTIRYAVVVLRLALRIAVYTTSTDRKGSCRSGSHLRSIVELHVACTYIGHDLNSLYGPLRIF
jgi:hypothetical protein